VLRAAILILIAVLLPAPANRAARIDPPKRFAASNRTLSVQPSESIAESASCMLRARGIFRDLCVGESPRSKDSRTFSASHAQASSSHFDDAMIPNRSKRMTIAQLKERMDSRFRATDARSDARFDAVEIFDAVDARLEAINARFDSLDVQFRRLFRSVESLAQKVGANTQGLADGLEHFDRALSEHDKRIRDLEPPPI
jgi:hypothetical protein